MADNAKGVARLSGPVTVRQICERFGITDSAFRHRIRRGQWNVRPAGRRPGKGRVWLYSGEEIERTAPDVLGAPVREPPETVTLADGAYTWIVAAANRIDRESRDLDRRNPGLRGIKPKTIIRWIDRGCHYLPRNPDGSLRKMRGHRIQYTLADRKQLYTRRYVHDGDLKLAIERRSGLPDDALVNRPGAPRLLPEPKARQFIGLGPLLFRRFILDADGCRKIMGRVIHPEPLSVNAASSSRRDARFWREEDMRDALAALERKAAEHPTKKTEAELRKLYPKLPKADFGTYLHECPYLPDRRPLVPTPDVLRRRQDGPYQLQTVYEESEVALIERNFVGRTNTGYFKKIVLPEPKPRQQTKADDAPKQKRPGRGRPATDRIKLREQKSLLHQVEDRPKGVSERSKCTLIDRANHLHAGTTWKQYRTAKRARERHPESFT